MWTVVETDREDFGEMKGPRWTAAKQAQGSWDRGPGIVEESKMGG